MLVPAFGWRSVFLVGVLFPLVLVPVAVKALPESLVYLAVRGRVDQVRLAIGVNQALSTVTSALYPAEVRATGVGWAFGAGRVGSLIAPLVGGLLLTRGVPGEVIFRLVAVPTILGAVTVAILVARIHRARRAATTDPVAA